MGPHDHGDPVSPRRVDYARGVNAGEGKRETRSADGEPE